LNKNLFYDFQEVIIIPEVKMNELWIG